MVAAQGHIEVGETAEQTAMREVAEETGVHGSVLAALGSIDYWFVTDGRRVHKTVHHYLMRFAGGELSGGDLEVAEVAWVPIRELPAKLAYADERRLAQVADELIDKLQTDGRRRCRRCRPAHRGGGHRPIRTPTAGVPTNPHRAGRTAAVQDRDCTATFTGGRVMPAPAGERSGLADRAHRRAARRRREPSATPFVQIRVDQVTPDVVTTTSEPVVTVSGIVTNVGDRPVHDVMVRLEHARRSPRRRRCAPASTATPINTSRSPISSRWQANCSADRRRGSRFPHRCAR
ncbi:NUDIX domain protein [Mycobacterium xenopi 3993]|nr:NUDIX domain protein [Mycobacterium xenopi 3993]